MNVEEWLGRQRSVSDGEADDGVEAAVFPRDEDPELFDAIEAYLDMRDVFTERAWELARLMRARGWEPI